MKKMSFKTVSGYMKDYVSINYKFGIHDRTELRSENIIL